METNAIKSANDKNILDNFFNKVNSYLSESKELVAILINLITAIILFIDKSRNNHYEYFTLIVEFLNLFTLIIAVIVLSQKYSLVIDDKADDKKNGSELMNLVKIERGIVENDDEVKTIVLDRIKRINTSVAQLIKSHRGFAASLIFLYVLMFVFDFNSQNENKQNNEMYKKLEKEQNDFLSRNTKCKLTEDSIFQIEKLSFSDLLNSRNLVKNIIPINYQNTDSLKIKNEDTSNDKMYKNYNLYKAQKISNLSLTLELINPHYVDSNTDFIKKISIYKQKLDTAEKKLLTEKSLVNLILKKDESNKKIIDYLLITILDNFFNILSGCFLFIAFNVLYIETIEKDNKTSTIDYLPTFMVGGAIFMFILLTITMGFFGLNLQKLTIISRILSGIFNGVGMALIFSRFISIEYFFKRSTLISRYYYFMGTIIILPAYSVVQPLFGLFDTSVTDSQGFIKSFVLLICLWGKIFFFLIVYSMVKNRWLHAYIYTLTFSEKRIREITLDIKDIKNLTD